MDLERIKETLRVAEGFREKMYHDSLGIPTIGYGRNLLGRGINLQEAEAMLERDVNESVEIAQHIPGYEMWSESQQEAVVEMCFVFGPGILNKWPNTFHAFEAGDWEGGIARIEGSMWMTQAPNRVKRVIEMLRE